MTVELLSVVLFFLGAAIGGWAGWFITARRARLAEQFAQQQGQAQLAAQRQELEARWHSERTALLVQQTQHQVQAQESERTHSRLQQEGTAWEEKYKDSERARRALELAFTREQAHTEAAVHITEERKQVLEQAREQFRSEFKQLSQQIFEEKTEKLSEQSRKLVEGTISPLREQLGDFKKKIEDVYEKETKDRVSLANQVERLNQQSQTLGQQALDLTQALRGQSKVRGTWGEQTLETLLEVSGLVRGVEFETQKSLRTEEGNLQPDVIVRLPDDRYVVIDAKVSLVDYLRYNKSQVEEERAEFLKQHIASMRGHINDLKKKHYPHALEKSGADFVLMFVPLEPAFLLALQHENDLFTEAYRDNVILIGPTTLIATLRIIDGIWRIRRQSDNAKDIADKAGKLWDKMAGVLESLEQVSKHLVGAQKYFAETMNRLSIGDGNLRGKAEELRKLGVKGKKELPPLMLQKMNALAGDVPSPQEAAVHTAPTLGIAVGDEP